MNLVPPKMPATGELIRRPEVSRLTGLSTSSLYLLMSKGEFPRPLKLTGKSVGWPRAEIEAWIKNLARRAVAPVEGDAKRRQPPATPALPAVLPAPISLRDHFAAAALQGFVSHPEVLRSMLAGSLGHDAEIAQAAYGIADAMLKAREA